MQQHHEPPPHATPDPAPHRAAAADPRAGGGGCCWTDVLSDEALLRIELRLHDRFYALRAADIRPRGALFSAWDWWTRVNVATRDRGLSPRRGGGGRPVS